MKHVGACEQQKQNAEQGKKTHKGFNANTPDRPSNVICCVIALASGLYVWIEHSLLLLYIRCGKQKLSTHNKTRCSLIPQVGDDCGQVILFLHTMAVWAQ